jgi:hypothetical protein
MIHLTPAGHRPVNVQAVLLLIIDQQTRDEFEPALLLTLKG